MNRIFVIGDIHGANKALLQCLERANFDFDNDKLICLGDVCDGWPDVLDSFETLFKIKNLVYVLGNHDQWFMENIKILNDVNNTSIQSWLYHGGLATLESYDGNKELMQKHLNFLHENTKLYHIEDNKMFVHAGYNLYKSIENNNIDDLLWSRMLWENAEHINNDEIIYDEVYIGHTPTIRLDVENNTFPITFNKICNLDTGAAFYGKLSMMDINSKEVFQSDIVKDLYPNHIGRNKK